MGGGGGEGGGRERERMETDRQTRPDNNVCRPFKKNNPKETKKYVLPRGHPLLFDRLSGAWGVV